MGLGLKGDSEPWSLGAKLGVIKRVHGRHEMGWQCVLCWVMCAMELSLRSWERVWV